MDNISLQNDLLSASNMLCSQHGSQYFHRQSACPVSLGSMSIGIEVFQPYPTPPPLCRTFHLSTVSLPSSHRWAAPCLRHCGPCPASACRPSRSQTAATTGPPGPSCLRWSRTASPPRRPSSGTVTCK